MRQVRKDGDCGGDDSASDGEFCFFVDEPKKFVMNVWRNGDMPLMFHEKIRRSPGSRLVIGLEGIDGAKIGVTGEMADNRRRFAGGGEISG